MKRRITRNELHMGIATLMSQRGTCGRAQVGCIITVDNRIISTGYNGPPPREPHCSEHVCDTSKTCSRAIHAEVNAIAHAARYGLSLNGSTLYCTHAPCPSCARLIIQSGISKVVYKYPYKVDEGLEILKRNGVTWLQLTD